MVSTEKEKNKMALYVHFKNKNTLLFIHIFCLLFKLQMCQIILTDPVQAGGSGHSVILALNSCIEQIDFSIILVKMALFQCNVCQKLFKRVDNLNRHKKNVYERKTGVQCKYCKKTFSRADNLKRHQKVCGKFFALFRFDF